MCLLFDNDQPCNHSECRLIMKVRQLNRDVFAQKQPQLSQNIATLHSLKDLEPPQKKHSLEEGSEENEIGKVQKWKRPMNWLNEIEEQNPQNIHQTVQQMGERMEGLQKTVKAIIVALEKNNIKLEF